MKHCRGGASTWSLLMTFLYRNSSNCCQKRHLKSVPPAQPEKLVSPSLRALRSSIKSPFCLQLHRMQQGPVTRSSTVLIQLDTSVGIMQRYSIIQVNCSLPQGSHCALKQSTHFNHLDMSLLPSVESQMEKTIFKEQL